MKNQVVLVLVDDDEDKTPTVYSVNDRGVVVIEDSEKDSSVHEDGVLRPSLSETIATSSVPARTRVVENSLKRKRDGVELNEQSLQDKKKKKLNTSDDSELNTFTDNDANTTQHTATNTPLVWLTDNECSTSHAPGSNEDQQNCSGNKQQMASPSNNNKNENSSSAKTNTSKHDKVVTKDPGIACPVCQQIFTGDSKSSCLAKHYRQVHLLTRLRCKKCIISTKCPFCSLGQKEWKFHELAEHINSGHQEHYDGLSYICPHGCKKLLRNTKALIDHYVDKHERVVYPHYTCDLCEGIGKHVQLNEENSLAHYIKEHGSVLTKDVYEAFARSRHALIVAGFNKDQLPSTLSEGSSPSVLPSTSNSKTSKSSSSSDEMPVISNGSRNTRSSAKNKLTLSSSSSDANVLTSVPSSQSSSSGRNNLRSCSRDKNNVPQTSSDKNKAPASSSTDESMLSSISSTRSSSNSRDNSPACSSEKKNMSLTSNNKTKTSSLSSSLRNKNVLPSISSIQSSSNSNSLACSSEKSNMSLTSSDKNKTPSSSLRDKNGLPSSNDNNVSTSNNDDKSATSSLDIIILTSSCNDQRKTRSSCRDKTDLSSTSNNTKNRKLPSSSSKHNNVLPSSDRRITRSFSSGKIDLTSATNNGYSQKSPLSSPKDKNALPLIANTQSSLNDKHDNLVSNSSNRSKSTTSSSTNKNKPASNTNNKKKVEPSSHNLRPSSRSREVSLSNDTVHLRTDGHRSSDDEIIVTIKNSLANAAVAKSAYVSNGVDGNKEASTSSSNGVLRNSSDCSTTTCTKYWLPVQTNDHRSRPSDASSSTRQQVTSHNGLSTVTSQSKAGVKGKDLEDRTGHRYIDATPKLNDISLMGDTHRKSSAPESATRKSQSNDKADKSSASLLSSDRSKTSCHSGNTVKGSCSTSQAPDKGTHSHTSSARGRTISAPSSTSGKRKCDTSPCSLQRENQSSCSVNKDKRGYHSTTDESQSCSTQCNSKDVHACDSHKRLRTQSAPSTTSSLPRTSVAPNSPRKVLSNLQNSNNLPSDSIQNLSKFSHIIFVDLDNWARFFGLPYPLSTTVFVWGFCGGNFMTKKVWSVHFRTLVQEKRFFQHPRCGTSKNAADFALCVQAARLDLQLPVHIPFTILSGDRGFGELRNQLKSSARQIHLVDPHHEEQDMLYGILTSIGEK